MERRQNAGTAIITTFTSRIRVVINKGSVSVCDYPQCLCVSELVQREGNTLERKRDYQRGRETFFYCPLSILNLKEKHLYKSTDTLKAFVAAVISALQTESMICGGVQGWSHLWSFFTM